MPIRTITTNSPEETEQFAKSLAERLHGGEVVELASDLGGGKTTFTRGLAAGIGSKDPVASPTFTVSREYAGGKFRMYHFDFYRLQEAGVMANEIAEVVGDPEAVVVVEWAEVVQHVLPESRIRVEITATQESQRELTITCPDELAYAVEGL